MRPYLLFFMAAFGALAHGKTPEPVTPQQLQNLVACTGKVSDWMAFSDAVAEDRTGLAPGNATDLGGKNWQLKQPLIVFRQSSTVLFMETWTRLYILVKTPDRRALAQKIAREFNLKRVDWGIEDLLDYRRELPDGNTLLLLSPNDKNELLLGCSYDPEKYEAARRAIFDASPERIAQKKRFKEILRNAP